MRRAGQVLMGMVSVVCGCMCPSTCLADLANAGDIAFIGFNVDGNDDFSIVLLADAAAGTVVYFNDNEWVDSNSDTIGDKFNSSVENEFSWTVGGAGLTAGTVVTFSNLRTTPTVSTGTLSGEAMSLGSGEAVYAFLGTDAVTPSTFLAAISNDVSIYNGTNNQTLSGTGLTLGTTALLLPASGVNLAHGGQYTGSRTGASSFADYIALIGNTAANWSVSTTDGTQFVPFNTTSFQVTGSSTPEPASLALMLLTFSLGALGRCTTSRRIDIR